jgi:hypothetical protein
MLPSAAVTLKRRLSRCAQFGIKTKLCRVKREGVRHDCPIHCRIHRD